MVANGDKPRDAWIACGRPNGDKGIQNIRKRGRLLMEAEAAEPVAEEPPQALALDSAPPAKKKYKIYSNARQTEQAQARQKETDASRKEIFKQATLDVAAAKRKGTLGDAGSTFDAIAAQAQALLPDGAKPITGGSLRAQSYRHKPGASPKKTGPPTKLPAELFEAAASFTQLKQVAGQEQKPAEVLQAMMGVIKGTALEEALASKPQQKRAKRKLRAVSGELSTQTSVAVDERRHQWLTVSNLTTWFNGGLSGGYEGTLEKHGFLPPRAAGETGPRDIHPAKRRRMLNMDETHHYMGTAGEGKGPRANVLVDARLGRSGRRKVENPAHITGMHWANYAGEIGAGMYLFPSAATEENARRIKLSWIDGLPHPLGFFGFDEQTEVVPSCSCYGSH